MQTMTKSTLHINIITISKKKQNKFEIIINCFHNFCIFVGNNHKQYVILIVININVYFLYVVINMLILEHNLHDVYYVDAKLLKNIEFCLKNNFLKKDIKIYCV